MYPFSSLPMPVALMVPSSTVQDSPPSVSPLKSRQPASVLPSKRSCQPSAFSALVRVLSLGAQPVTVITAAAARKSKVFFMLSLSVVNREQNYEKETEYARKPGFFRIFTYC